MASLNQDQIKVLEQTRQRLVQLTRSLGSLVASLNQSDPLPSWSSLQSQATIISNNLLSTTSQLSQHQDLLRSLVAYPAPDYPARTQANTLEQLLRTKLDPRVDDWVSRGRAAAGLLEEDRGSLSERELAELWEWAPIEANQEARRRNWGGDFTLEEREGGVQNVVTGLKRVLVDEDEEEDEEDEEDEVGERDDEMEVQRKTGEFDIASVKDRVGSGKPVVPLDDILRFMTTGQPPRQR